MPTANVDQTSADASGLPREQLVAFLAEMLLIRRFEEKVEERFRAGDLPGFLHVCIGQEAVAVGVCRALADGDVIASTHRAHGHVIANGTLDGQDVEAVHGAGADALVHARAGHGPVFLLCETERLTGHYIGDPQVYRDKDELRRLRETRDPIQNLRERLALGDEEWARLDAEAHSTVDASVEFAQAGTDPTPSDALDYVYAEGQ